jgi:hypothetical protein
MRHLLIVILLAITSFSYSQIDQIKGIYAGESLYVQQYVNHINKTDFVFCLDSIVINDSVRIYEIDYAAFEIELQKFKLGAKLTINFFGKPDCHIKILNRKALEFKQDFIEIKEINQQHVKFKVDRAIADMVSLQFFQYQKWVKGNEWTIVDSAYAIHHDTIIDFDLKPNVIADKRLVAHLKDGGKNDYLVMKLEIPGKLKKQSCDFKPKKPKTELILEKTQSYVIYDSFGDIVSQGRAREINIKSLVKGSYFLELEYCNDMHRFVKK